MRDPLEDQQAPNHRLLHKQVPIQAKALQRAVILSSAVVLWPSTCVLPEGGGRLMPRFSYFRSRDGERWVLSGQLCRPWIEGLRSLWRCFRYRSPPGLEQSPSAENGDASAAQSGDARRTEDRQKP